MLLYHVHAQLSDHTNSGKEKQRVSKDSKRVLKDSEHEIHRDRKYVSSRNYEWIFCSSKSCPFFSLSASFQPLSKYPSNQQLAFNFFSSRSSSSGFLYQFWFLVQVLVLVSSIGSDCILVLVPILVSSVSSSGYQIYNLVCGMLTLTSPKFLPHSEIQTSTPVLLREPDSLNKVAQDFQGSGFSLLMWCSSEIGDSTRSRNISVFSRLFT